ncbi:hypothetical protein GALMADRAFT_254828 [Galerina marginata CBS 339.88]|uniref:Uncharacterized protein n=1 Tax=Galerina marginata (strain CBS 339.88) TaxID=685588 RepID=A0A067SHE9_GALM3|nr:hypothetical protein GALMADRAFT_254828 [Galerina marginata CBS 339.88]
MQFGLPKLRFKPSTFQISTPNNGHIDAPPQQRRQPPGSRVALAPSSPPSSRDVSAGPALLHALATGTNA